MKDQLINVEVASHKETGLLLATSSDLPGLMVHGRSLAEIEERLPIAARDILEHQGHRVMAVTVEKSRLSGNFWPAHVTVNASMANAA
ncbi:DUF1902 domain-containing protein [Xanthobacter tagetidis]|uniref:DUF1902 domain-containing protein n=1 Tax=Xanthobacter tagetidis TaxID=60216 RepID=A0A3L7AHU8_9HYPH|nr:DUF1902 domain-containing protein [Xanthobacter tagetidis]MBB6306259.1 hypothetical protein [Xanthobacter tagetidis]RLP79535.1 hypothetical protein D9R14_07685 [Xanthobacter tagetidis]